MPPIGRGHRETHVALLWEYKLGTTSVGYRREVEGRGFKVILLRVAICSVSPLPPALLTINHHQEDLHKMNGHLCPSELFSLTALSVCRRYIFNAFLSILEQDLSLSFLGGFCASAVVLLFNEITRRSYLVNHRKSQCLYRNNGTKVSVYSKSTQQWPN